MSTSAAVKICKVCGKDVSQTKRIKDTQGAYYCEVCSHKLTARAAVGAKGDAGRGKPPAVQVALAGGGARSGHAPANDGHLPPDEPDPKATLKPAPVPIAAPAGKIPEKCPHCGTPVFTKSTRCIRCQRDLTQASALPREQEPQTAEKLGNLASQIIRVVMVVGVLAVLAFGGWGLYLVFGTSHDPFAGYPTKRQAAVKEFLTHISKGNDAAYTKAFWMVSFRARTTNNPNEIGLYKRLFTHINDEFTRKHGAGWINMVEINPQGVQDTFEIDDYEVLTIKIGKDEYHVSTQVQIALDQVIGNLPGNLRQKMSYPEDDKNRFGVIQIEEYPVDWRAKRM